MIVINPTSTPNGGYFAFMIAAVIAVMAIS